MMPLRSMSGGVTKNVTSPEPGRVRQIAGCQLCARRPNVSFREPPWLTRLHKPEAPAQIFASDSGMRAKITRDHRAGTAGAARDGVERSAPGRQIPFVHRRALNKMEFRLNWYCDIAPRSPRRAKFSPTGKHEEKCNGERPRGAVGSRFFPLRFLPSPQSGQFLAQTKTGPGPL